MASISLAGPPRTSTPVTEETRRRVLKGYRLYKERGDEVERAPRPAHFYVPGCSGGRYEVTLGFGEDTPSCTCRDFERRGLPCKHIYCLEVWTAHRNRRRPATPRPRRPLPEFAAVA